MSHRARRLPSDRLFGNHRAHRVSYEWERGAIPIGLECDHLCRVRSCVRPSHIELVTKRENVLRGIGPTAHNAKKTACKHGHPYTPENTGRSTSSRYRTGRRCRTCDRLSHAEKRAATSQEALEAIRKAGEP